MRCTYLIILCSSFTCLAAPLKFKELMTKSANLRNEIKSEKSLEKKKSKLRDFEQVIKKNIEQYKELSPEEGSSEETFVVKFYYSLEPVFELLSGKISDEDCKKASHQIQIEDRDMTGVNPKLSVEAEEAIQVLKTFCNSK